MLLNIVVLLMCLFQGFNTASATLSSKKHKFNSVTFISSNALKIGDVMDIMIADAEAFPFELRIRDIELDELQASPTEIARDKIERARNVVDGPILVEDTCLCFNAMGGLPGPYIKWFYEAIGNDGLARMLDGFEDKTCYAQSTLSFSLGKGHEIATFVGRSAGTVVFPRDPEAGFGWDPIFLPESEDYLTFADMSCEAKNAISHRYRAFQEFKNYISEM